MDADDIFFQAMILVIAVLIFMMICGEIVAAVWARGYII